MCAPAHLSVYMNTCTSKYVCVCTYTCVLCLGSLTRQILLHRYRIPPGQCNWINIDEQSGEVRTVRVLDRDIGEMRRGQCNVTVLAIDRSEY